MTTRERIQVFSVAIGAVVVLLVWAGMVAASVGAL